MNTFKVGNQHWSKNNTPTPYTSKKIMVERIVTAIEIYEIHPEQIDEFMDCDDYRLEIDFGKPTDEHHTDKRSVLTGDLE